VIFVTDEASFLGGKSGLLVEFSDFSVELIESDLKRARERIVGGRDGRPLGAQVIVEEK
jgi:hypothetical protein